MARTTHSGHQPFLHPRPCPKRVRPGGLSFAAAPKSSNCPYGTMPRSIRPLAKQNASSSPQVYRCNAAGRSALSACLLDPSSRPDAQKAPTWTLFKKDESRCVGRPSLGTWLCDGPPGLRDIQTKSHSHGMLAKQTKSSGQANRPQQKRQHRRASTGLLSRPAGS